jgi:hypothetical protein
VRFHFFAKNHVDKNFTCFVKQNPCKENVYFTNVLTRKIFMNKVEFISYRPTPHDQYTKGFAILLTYVPMLVTYRRALKKDGGEFFTDPQVQYVADAFNGKSYQHIFQPNIRSDEELIKSACEAGYQAWKAQQSATSMSEVAANDNLPF